MPEAACYMQDKNQSDECFDNILNGDAYRQVLQQDSDVFHREPSSG